MTKTTIAAALLAGISGLATPAHAQKEMMAMLYAMQVAPRACNWTPVAATTKLDANIAMQERALGVTSAERAAMLRQAENEIKSDPTSCEADGILRTMFNEAVK